jgi:hypothetical protein
MEDEAVVPAVGTEPTERPSTYPPHHRFCLSISWLVKSLIVRDKRQIYVSMRSGEVSANSFFPKFGLSAADYAVWQILNDNPRRTFGNKA